MLRSEPIRVIAVVLAAVVAGLTAWQNAPDWVPVVLAALTVAAGELGRSRVTPAD